MQVRSLFLRVVPHAARADSASPPLALPLALADDYIVIALSDANFERYGITKDDIRRSLTRNPKVHVALLAIGEGAETTWLPQVLPGKAFTVRQTGDLSRTIRTVLSATLDKGL